MSGHRLHPLACRAGLALQRRHSSGASQFGLDTHAPGRRLAATNLIRVTSKSKTVCDASPTRVCGMDIHGVAL